MIGEEGLNLLKSLKIKIIRTNNSSIYTADNTVHKATGYCDIPIVFKNQTQVISFLIVPSLKTNIILGVDFWDRFALTIARKNKKWNLSALSTSKDQNPKIVGYDELSSDQKKKLKSVVDCFKKLSPKKENQLGRTNLFEYDIDTGDALPTCQRCYPVSPEILRRQHEALQRMIDMDVVEPSNSPWRAPVVIVRKPNGKDRFCIDSRAVNAVTIRDAYPLPSVSEALDKLSEANFITTIDLKDAFWQIPLKKSARQKTAFYVPGKGLWQMKVVGFGFRNSAQAMQRLMDAVFGDRFFPYVDDLVITTKTFDEHIEALKYVYERLVFANLTINFDKCKFCRPELKYLGYIVNRNGLRTDPEKVQIICEFPRPKNTTEVKRFIGLISWYRRFIKNFATIAAPIHNLLKGREKGKPIQWNPKAENSFKILKEKLVTSPILSPPNFSLGFSIHCDASNAGISAVLCQGVDEKPVVFASRKYRNNEAKYSVTERECLAALFGLEKFRPYIEGYHFKIITDHSALLWLLKSDKLPNDRLARWVLKFSPFDFEIHHRKGKNHTVPDILSRSLPETIDTGISMLFDSNEINDPSTLPQQESKVNSRINESYKTESISEKVRPIIYPVNVVDFSSAQTDIWYNLMVDKVSKEPQKYSK